MDYRFVMVLVAVLGVLLSGCVDDSATEKASDSSMDSASSDVPAEPTAPEPAGPSNPAAEKPVADVPPALPSEPADSPPAPPAVVAPPASPTIPIMVLFSGMDSKVKQKSYFMIASLGWENFWRDNFNGEAPEVDFSESTVFAAMLGSKSTGGYSIEPIEAKDLGDSIEIRVREVAPTPDCEVTQALTNPYFIGSIPRTSKPVKLVFEMERRC